mgnify:CR=1 FL=1
MYKAFLIKYGEIGVKGKNRFIFEDALVRQIKFSLKDVEEEQMEESMLMHFRTMIMMR